MNNNKTKILGRRSFIKKTSVAALGTAIGSTGITGFPTIWAQNIKNVTLRQFGTGVSNINAIAKKAKEDLGINLEMTALDTDSTAQRVVTQPKSFDIADIEYFTLKKVWPSGNMQPMDINNTLCGVCVCVGTTHDAPNATHGPHGLTQPGKEARSTTPRTPHTGHMA